MSKNAKYQCWAAAAGLKHRFRLLRASCESPQLDEPCSYRTSLKHQTRGALRLSVGEAVRDATLPYCDGREQHHRGHVVEKCRENGRDETEDDDHGPHSAPGQLISLR